MESLDQLSRSVQELLTRYEAQSRELEQLRAANQQQREEMMRTHAELVEIEQQYARLRLASSMTGTPDERDAARRRLTQIITHIDHVLEILKQ